MVIYPVSVVLHTVSGGIWGQLTSTTQLVVGTRVLGVTIFTLVVQQILTQEYRPFFNRVFGPYFTKRYHIVVGTSTLLLACFHPLLYYISLVMSGVGLSEILLGANYQYPLRLFYLLGPTAITILFATALSGLLRNWEPLKKYWYIIHKLNYVLFVVAFFHSWNMGEDVGAIVSLRILWILYAVVLVVGFGYKFWLRPYLIRKDSASTEQGQIPDHGHVVAPLGRNHQVRNDLRKGIDL